MKYIILILSLLLTANVQAQSCNQETLSTTTDEREVEVTTDMPKHLTGATITITLANGSSSTVPASKFMVVPRKHKKPVLVVTTNTSKLICQTPQITKSNKNLIQIGASNSTPDIRVRTEVSSVGFRTTVTAEKTITPDVSYYRSDIVGGFGAGVGVDSNGAGRISVGFGF